LLTANEDAESEAMGLTLGAIDFIKKPFSSEVLKIRVRNILDLILLQKDLQGEVQKKTSELESLSLHVVQTLAKTIDAKDAYTNGHSERVADYSREIAKRYGYDKARQEEIYMMGLLHDVGKIGVPDEVINKPGRLTDEEFAKIKKHPGIGGKILGNIKEMPELAAGAKWHHERYDGKGYPEGLKGDEIPEEARIIAVADAFDAMTSNRSYRDAIPLEIVKGEIEKGRGSQFDPKFADIMIGLIDEGFLLS
jgi:putative two-component system response regulator